MDVVNMDEVLARYSLGKATPEEMVGAALQAMAEGAESEEVVMLGGLTKPLYLRETQPLFLEMIAQLGKKVPSEKEAAIFLARIQAKRIVAKEVDLLEGVRAIARLWLSGDRPQVLMKFYAIDDELSETLTAFDDSSIALKKEKEDRIKRLKEFMLEYVHQFLKENQDAI